MVMMAVDAQELKRSYELAQRRTQLEHVIRAGKMFYCHTCRKETRRIEDVDYTTGWPRCCGITMDWVTANPLKRVVEETARFIGVSGQPIRQRLAKWQHWASLYAPGDPKANWYTEEVERLRFVTGLNDLMAEG